MSPEPSSRRTATQVEADRAREALAEVLVLERQVWDALVSGDAESDRRLLHPEFIGVYPTGLSSREEHADMATDASPRFSSYELSESRLALATERARLLVYRAHYRTSPTARQQSMYVSSLWTHDGSGWSNRFSQDTPCAPDL